jgi:hypothetical protein
MFFEEILWIYRQEFIEAHFHDFQKLPVAVKVGIAEELENEFKEMKIKLRGI